jgi:hypothetical protein
VRCCMLQVLLDCCFNGASLASALCGPVADDSVDFDIRKVFRVVLEDEDADSSSSSGGPGASDAAIGQTAAAAAGGGVGAAKLLTSEQLVLQCLWQVLASWEPQQKRAFVKFVTGSVRCGWDASACNTTAGLPDALCCRQVLTSHRTVCSRAIASVVCMTRNLVLLNNAALYRVCTPKLQVPYFLESCQLEHALCLSCCRLPAAGSEQLLISFPFVAYSSRQQAQLLGTLPQSHTCANTLELPNYVEALTATDAQLMQEWQQAVGLQEGRSESSSSSRGVCCLELRRRCCEVLQDRLLVSQGIRRAVVKLAVMHAIWLHRLTLDAVELNMLNLPILCNVLVTCTPRAPDSCRQQPVVMWPLKPSCRCRKRTDVGEP